MRIKKTGMYLELEQKLKESNFLQLILDEIFLICMSDMNFSSKNVGDNLIETQLTEMKTKIIKQGSMLKESLKLQEDFSKKILFLDHENSKIKNKLLRSLGGE